MGFPVIDIEMVLDFAGSDARHGATGEFLVGVVAVKCAVLLAEVAVVYLDSGILEVSGCVALESPVARNVHLVTHASEVVSKALPHVLNGVDFDVLDPFVMLILWV